MVGVPVVVAMIHVLLFLASRPESTPLRFSTSSSKHQHLPRTRARVIIKWRPSQLLPTGVRGGYPLIPTRAMGLKDHRSGGSSGKDDSVAPGVLVEIVGHHSARACHSPTLAGLRDLHADGGSTPERGVQLVGTRRGVS